jgi:hypothetical protein
MSLRRLIFTALLASLAGVAAPLAATAEEGSGHPTSAPPAPLQQTAAEAQSKSAGCMSCHTTTDSLNMHTTQGVTLGCADCHGGRAEVFVPPGAPRESREYRAALDAAHVHPRNPEA